MSAFENISSGRAPNHILNPSNGEYPPKKDIHIVLLKSDTANNAVLLAKEPPILCEGGKKLFPKRVPTRNPASPAAVRAKSRCQSCSDIVPVRYQLFKAVRTVWTTAVVITEVVITNGKIDLGLRGRARMKDTLVTNGDAAKRNPALMTLMVSAVRSRWV